MGILRKFREWREDKDGTLIGPDIEADSVDAGSVNTGGATIANKGFEPFYDFDKSQSFSGSSTHSFNVSSDPDSVFIWVLAHRSNINGGNLGIRVNSDDGGNYNWIRNDGGDQTGQDNISFASNTSYNASGLVILTKSSEESSVAFTVRTAMGRTDLDSHDFLAQSGYNDSVSDIQSVQVVDDGGADDIDGLIQIKGVSR